MTYLFMAISMLCALGLILYFCIIYMENNK